MLRVENALRDKTRGTDGERESWEGEGDFEGGEGIVWLYFCSSYFSSFFSSQHLLFPRFILRPPPHAVGPQSLSDRFFLPLFLFACACQLNTEVGSEATRILQRSGTGHVNGNRGRGGDPCALERASSDLNASRYTCITEGARLSADVVLRTSASRPTPARMLSQSVKRPSCSASKALLNSMYGSDDSRSLSSYIHSTHSPPARRSFGESSHSVVIRVWGGRLGPPDDCSAASRAACVCVQPFTTMRAILRAGMPTDCASLAINESARMPIPHRAPQRSRTDNSRTHLPIFVYFFIPWHPMLPHCTLPDTEAQLTRTGMGLVFSGERSRSSWRRTGWLEFNEVFWELKRWTSDAVV
eukprot:Rhum_TRINITY_DN12267_c0_g1::Rhum_TRINITY_DN12267_c0_g1_i1::g.50790::m.50790